MPNHLLSEQCAITLESIQKSRSWIDVGQIARISGVSLAKSRVFVANLVLLKKIGTKHIFTPIFPDGTALYANLHLASLETKKRQNNDDFKYAKSKFEIWPELMDGKTHHIYVAKPNQSLQLALLSRRIN